MRTFTVACSMILLMATSSSATTYLVNPNGTGDFPTIQAAIDAAVNGDIIELADGTFRGDGNREIAYWGKVITVRSRSGRPERCIIDCEGTMATPRRGFHLQHDETPESVLEGVTIINGWAHGGWPEATGGGLLLSGSDATIRHCVFMNNYAVDGGGGATATSGSWAKFENCVFQDNATVAPGGGVGVWSGSLVDFEGCTFAGNTATSGSGGGIAFVWSSCILWNCTFSENASPYAAVFSGYGSGIELHSCIIAFSATGAAIECGGVADPVLTCCDLYDNPGGDWVACIADQYGINGNISADPQFCGSDWNPLLPYLLAGDSPCAPGSTPGCGLIGAWPVGCDDPSRVDPDGSLARVRLYGCLPNPLVTEAAIRFAIPEALSIHLGVYDVGGRTVRTLIGGAVREAGHHRVRWDGLDDSGRRVDSGVYFYRLEAGAFAQTRKLMVAK